MSVPRSKASYKQQQNNALSVQNEVHASIQIDSYKKTRLLNKLKTIIATLYQNRQLNIKILSRHDGFTIQDTPQNIHQFDQLIHELFSLDVQTFNSELASIGFRIRNKHIKNELKIILYKYYEAFIESSPTDRLADQSQDQSINDRLLQQEYKEVGGNDVREQPQKVAVANNGDKVNRNISKRSNIILNKFSSQGVMQSYEMLRSYEDISLQANLPQNQYYQTPLNPNRTFKLKQQPQLSSSQNQNNSKLSSDHQVLEKISSYKQNYEKCSKLIDSTIIKILHAHRANSIGRQSELLLNQITQIYDIMSDNIENVNYTLQYVEKKEKKKEAAALREHQILGSPGFKPINQDI